MIEIVHSSALQRQCLKKNQQKNNENINLKVWNFYFHGFLIWVAFSNGILDFGSLDAPCFGTLILDRVSDSILFLVVPLLPIIIPKKALAIWKDAWNQSRKAFEISSDFGWFKYIKKLKICIQGQLQIWTGTPVEISKNHFNILKSSKGFHN